MIDESHPVYDTVRLVGSYTYDESRLIAEGNYSQLLERLRSHVQREHYFQGLMQGSGAVLVLYWGRELTRSYSTYHVVWLVLSATVLGAGAWRWRKRKRALRLALARLERKVSEGHPEGAGV